MHSLYVPRAPVRALLRAVAAALLLAAGAAPAQQAERFGPYEVHYNALNTNLLTPEVARAYGIQRAGTRAMLNVTVLHTEDNRAVPATVTASATNLTNQRRSIELREVRDQEAIYYLGTFRVTDEEWMNFSIEVQPEGRVGPPFTFSFRQQFYTD
ncbi:DUF4426 domain-containing protein [Wenzhouxiangella sp. XN79A]|uniref:DUF4426 domain-containing protein n=1 Tax=Wenzhouxiangella sp. XN79A TaxID=2724193 RepID=UPI00144A951C|nr:DUF4426 domain-containing protein [Wenzhouxiangella sp. XN79A]NKI35029.1 DUF4426 domain-containing protein [Wenzhouxiangella sp. XN79A]